MTWIIVGSTMFLLLFAVIAIPLVHTAKLKKRLAAEFGRPPKAPQGLRNAERFYDALSSRYGDAAALDDISWHDLELDEVFARLNTCHSAVGDVRLYTVLRRGSKPEVLAARQDMMELFRENPALRLRVQYRLARLGRQDGQGLEMTLFHAGALTPRFYPLLCFLAVVPFLALLLLPWQPGAALGLAALFLAININVNALAKAKTESGFGAVRFLAGALACARLLVSLLQPHSPAAAKCLKDCDKRFAAYRVPVFLLTLSNLMEESLGFDFMGILLLPMVCYGFVTRRLYRGLGETQELYRLLGEVDLALCTLAWQMNLPVSCKPAYVPEKLLRFEGLYHPLLPDAVPNSAVFTGGVLLTGSNASGKSTFLKAVALSCVFAQGLGICPAKTFTLKAGRVATSMAVADSTVDGDSYFIAEIKSMRRLMRQEEFGYYFIDEILKGTNTIERVAASTAVLRQLAEQNCLCFAATHDGELTLMLRESYRNCHFRETVTQNGIEFDYKLHEGAARSRNALLLLERMAYPEQVIRFARGLAARFEESGEWVMEEGVKNKGFPVAGETP